VGWPTRRGPFWADKESVDTPSRRGQTRDEGTLALAPAAPTQGMRRLWNTCTSFEEAAGEKPGNLRSGHLFGDVRHTVVGGV
jgi:hypothetical protein